MISPKRLIPSGVFVNPIDKDDFFHDELRQSTKVQNLIIIGEAALSIDFREKHPDIEWNDIVGFRNFTSEA